MVLLYIHFVNKERKNAIPNVIFLWPYLKVGTRYSRINKTITTYQKCLQKATGCILSGLYFQNAVFQLLIISALCLLRILLIPYCTIFPIFRLQTKSCQTKSRYDMTKGFIWKYSLHKWHIICYNLQSIGGPSLFYNTLSFIGYNTSLSDYLFFIESERTLNKNKRYHCTTIKNCSQNCRIIIIFITSPKTRVQ